MFAHMDLRTVSCKMYIVHIRFNQRDAAPMRGGGVRGNAICQYFSEIESFSLICHDD